ncbi:hypothetical protein ACFWYA_28655 [Streptomyces sp. NPDC059011]|uniref:hypothetical protein n=1 Tax=unclassified Streptomyces TaxID=2593676 RepID=UPI00369E9668
MGFLPRIVGVVRARRYPDAYTGCLLAVLVTVLEIVSGFTQNRNWIDVLFSSTVVLLLGLIALATADIRIRQNTVLNGARGGLLFTGRSQLPALGEQLQGAHRTVEIYGLQLGHVVHHMLPTIADRALSDCHFRLALLSPVDANGDKVPWIGDMGAVHGFPNLEDVLRANLAHLRHWHAGLTPKQQRNIEIRAYPVIPTASVILFDVKKHSGYAHVEPILHTLPPMERPTFWITEKDDFKLFHLLVDHYQELWQQAIALPDLAL